MKMINTGVKIKILLTLAFICGVWGVAHAEDPAQDCPTEVNACLQDPNVTGISSCTEQLTAPPTAQPKSHGFICPFTTQMQYEVYGCYLPGGKYYPNCQGIPSGIQVVPHVSFATANFDYSAPTSQQFRVIYCCEFEDKKAK